ncbi:MAG: hypothetical protein EXR73_13870 [Myxococcales bacterium]|nr:hypothetical protein [Myxococcales bacterium]
MRRARGIATRRNPSAVAMWHHAARNTARPSIEGGKRGALQQRCCSIIALHEADLLHAHLHGKLGRALGAESEDDPRVRIRASEDALTAMVFGRLRYLPDTVAWTLITHACTPLRGAIPAFVPVEIEMQFWPQLAADDGGRVEPDVVWRAVDAAGGVAVIGFEMKWRTKQTAGQLDREWRALRRAYPDAARALVAVGGADFDEMDALSRACAAENLVGLRWSVLREALRDRMIGAEPQVRRLISDVLCALDDRGLRDMRFFETLPSWRTAGPPRLDWRPA